MGKSPGKWIKTILFGKKPSKSSFLKVLSYCLSVFHCCSQLWSDSFSLWIHACLHDLMYHVGLLVWREHVEHYNYLNDRFLHIVCTCTVVLFPFLEILISSCHVRIPYYLISHASNDLCSIKLCKRHDNIMWLIAHLEVELADYQCFATMVCSWLLDQSVEVYVRLALCLGIMYHISNSCNTWNFSA